MSRDRIATLRTMLASDPNDAFMRYALALELAAQNDLPAACSMLIDLQQLHPDYVPAYHQLGVVYERQGETENARTAYAQGIAAAMRTGDAHAAGEMQEALDLLEE